MSVKVEGVPKFATEREEAEWWDANPNLVVKLFERAEAEGKITRGTTARRLGLSTTATTIRLSNDDLAKARTQAEAKGLRYQTYLKMLLHEALAQESKETSSSSRRPQPQAQRPARKQTLAAARSRAV
jgi:predicted DNA binding CopG/RHH family protein